MGTTISTPGAEGLLEIDPHEKDKNAPCDVTLPSQESKSLGGIVEDTPRNDTIEERSGVGSPSPPGFRRGLSAIRDDQVHVNLAMADLMAYLQVVANNSNNLPITRRDDPEVARASAKLSAEEYARKSAAFVPADVRVIAGSFTRYGRVWDLPTSEEYSASDGAQEPGRSYGGACSNAMLKVLYDAANEAGDAAQTKEASEALFVDDEEDESVVKSVPSIESGFSLVSTISWATLLRRMTAEISDIEYAQVPLVSTTRKFDLLQPFSFVTPDFDPSTGKKRALLIGCNYTNVQGAELKASHDDIGSMKDYIVNVHGFSETPELMTVLLDDDYHSHPTHLNITEAFKSLSEQSQPGDVVFIQFSGHGGRVLDTFIEAETESYDEVIVPSDYAVSGLIRDTLIFKTLLAPMRYGVTVTLLIDCCDTGSVLELPYKWTPAKNDRPDRMEHSAKLGQNEEFSFVRFLKVVRRLYESSTFTQLGKTVGSVLNAPPEQEPVWNNTKRHNGFKIPGVDDEDEEEIVTVGQDSTATTKTGISVRHKKNLSILSKLVNSCASPGHDEDHNDSTSSRHHHDRGIDDDTQLPASPSSNLLDQAIKPATNVLEQVINCTLGQDDGEYSDDETYLTRTVDLRDSYGDTVNSSSSFESLTEDGSTFRSRRSHRTRRSRKRR